MKNRQGAAFIIVVVLSAFILLLAGLLAILGQAGYKNQAQNFAMDKALVIAEKELAVLTDPLNSPSISSLTTAAPVMLDAQSFYWTRAVLMPSFKVDSQPDPPNLPVSANPLNLLNPLGNIVPYDILKVYSVGVVTNGLPLTAATDLKALVANGNSGTGITVSSARVIALTVVEKESLTDGTLTFVPNTAEPVVIAAEGNPAKTLPRPSDWQEIDLATFLGVVGIRATAPTTGDSLTEEIRGSFTITAGENGSAAPGGETPLIYLWPGAAITATPAPGYHFVSWTVTNNSGTNNPPYVSVAEAGLTETTVAATSSMPQGGTATVTATFAINTYTLTYTAGVNGTIAGTSPQTVNFGTSGAQVTAVPSIGYHFVKWSDGGTTATRTDTNVTADISVVAAFAINIYTLTYTAGSGGTISGTSPQTVNYGTDGGQVTAVPNTGYHFVAWSDGVATATRTDANITADKGVTAAFAIDTFTLTYIAGSGGTVSGTTPQIVNYGAFGTAVTAVPNTGYHLVDWSDGWTGRLTRTDSITVNKTFTANFGINTYNITASTGSNGTVTPTGVTPKNYLATQAYLITPATGYHIASVTVDGGAVAATSPYTFTALTANHTISATFTINTYTLTYTAGANGTISGTSPQTINYGASGTQVTAVPNTNYRFVNWSDAGSSTGRTDSNITANITVIANFDLNNSTVTFVDWNGTVLSTPSVNYGGTAPAPSSPTRAGYTFTGWNKSLANITAATTITAIYTINSYTVTFVDWNGTVLSTPSVNYGGTAPAPGNPTRTGYTFVGWNRGLTNITAATTITATYNINYYTVTFVNGLGTTLSTQAIAYGGNATAPGNPTRTGYTFTGWVGTYTGITGPVTITATWNINSYTVTFVNGYGGTISTQAIAYGGNATAPGNPTRTGYTFAGWSGTYTNITSAVIITANWNIISYLITASTTGAGSITGSQWVAYGGSVTFYMTPYSGYTRWYTLVDGVNQGAITSYTFSNVAGSHTINTHFYWYGVVSYSNNYAWVATSSAYYYPTPWSSPSITTSVSNYIYFTLNTTLTPTPFTISMPSGAGLATASLSSYYYFFYIDNSPTYGTNYYGQGSCSVSGTTVTFTPYSYPVGSGWCNPIGNGYGWATYAPTLSILVTFYTYTYTGQTANYGYYWY